MAELSRVESLFAQAVSKSTAERGAFLDDACRDEPELRSQIERLLAVLPDAGQFLEAANGQETASVSENVPASTADYPGKDEVLGATIAGKYKLLEVIGEGGMGSVYMAQQTAPVKRFVAMKVIKAGMDSKSVLARFDAERQALAVMDHPNIAKVLDAGVTDQQRPFFVMELVKGLPITEYCDLRKLTPRQRLELFVPVCQAIQHAHQKGIIHRDIKPSNVIVALYDDRPVPKVIDFGVAKATGVTLTEQTLATGFGGIVGTPQYMSPEQATFNNLDIDTRSDVYSLGVLLYELLAGSPPFSRKDLEKAGFLEILRVVREEEPPRPSAKLSTAAAVASLCANRGMEPRKLAGLLRNELDWIAMKALEKDRTRRYETANGLAADIQRYLAGEPVQAHPPTLGYRLRKAYRRNRTVVLATTAVVVAALLAAVGQTWNLMRARDAEAAAKKSEIRANVETQTANEQRIRALELQKEAERRTASITLDAALRELDLSPREGLVRLAEAYAAIPGWDVAQRQSALMALLIAGQDLAPHFPPPEEEIYPGAISPDGRLGIGSQGSHWKVFDVLTGQCRAVLGPEESYFSGMLPRFDAGYAAFDGEGQVAATLHMTRAGHGTVKLWSVGDWKELRSIDPGRGVVHTLRLHAGASRAVTVSLAREEGIRPRTVPYETSQFVELWDLTSGRRIAMLDHGRQNPVAVFLDRFGQTIYTVSRAATLRAWSAVDGSLLTTWAIPDEYIVNAALNPAGTALVLACRTKLFWWNCKSKAQEGPAVPIDYRTASNEQVDLFEFLSDDVFILRMFIDDLNISETPSWQTLCVRGEPKALDLPAVASYADHVLTDDGRVFSLKPLKQLTPIQGQLFPYQARIATKGQRFAVINKALYDLETDKSLGLKFQKPCPRIFPCEARGVAGTLLGNLEFGRYQLRRTIPAPDLAITSDQARLWARVVACGAVNPATGMFEPDDEPAWERHRLALLAMPAETGEFPFPGVAATDRLYWLRHALDGEKDKGKKTALADRLIAAEPTRQNHLKRALIHNDNGRQPEALRDCCAAWELATVVDRNLLYDVLHFGNETAKTIVENPDRLREAYELALQWHEQTIHGWGALKDEKARRRARSHWRLDLQRMQSEALTRYRLGQYAPALEALRRGESFGAAQLAAGLASPVTGLAFHQAALECAIGETSTAFHLWNYHRGNLYLHVLEAMCLTKLNRTEEAQRALARARDLHAEENARTAKDLTRGAWGHEKVIKEALKLMEGEKEAP